MSNRFRAAVIAVNHTVKILSLLLISTAGLLALWASSVQAVTQQQSGSVGIEGMISSSPPTQAATITVPSNGQTFTNLPITVSGICPKGLLVEIFKNDVFAGSTKCATGSYSLSIDLFDGRNDLVARVYDSLNQAGPDSNKVGVTFNSGSATSGPRIILISSFASRGATPGTSLTWPLSLSGGKGPYAISVDWGDKTSPDLISRTDGGDFTVDHIYSNAGVYNVTIKASDANGVTAFLQLVGIGNGPIQQSNGGSQSGNPVVKTQKVVIWWPLIVTFVLIIVAFWVGKQHQLEVIRERLRKGERPFK